MLEPMEERTCKCGNKFKVFVKSTHIYCSKKCEGVAKIFSWWEKAGGRKKG